MTGALEQLGYEDKVTGRLEKLPLATITYDPETEAKKRYERGERVVVWHYNSNGASWGEPSNWEPGKVRDMPAVKRMEGKKTAAPASKPAKVKEPAPAAATYNRTIRDLTPAEKLELERALEKGAPNKVIMRGMGLKRTAIDQYRHYLKTHSAAQQSSSPAVQKPSSSAESIPSIEDPWAKIKSLMSNILEDTDGIAFLTKNRQEKALELSKLLAKVTNNV